MVGSVPGSHRLDVLLVNTGLGLSLVTTGLGLLVVPAWLELFLVTTGLGLLLVTTVGYVPGNRKVGSVLFFRMV
jgi:hypothetical protein